MCVCVCVCVCERERETERQKVPSVVNILKFKGSLCVSNFNIFIMCDKTCCSIFSVVGLNNV